MFTAFLLAAAVPTPAVPLDRPSWFTANDYPAEAMKKGAHGTVTFVVNVDAAGTPTACHVTKSSGEPILDQTTCNIILARAHFKPGVDSTGKSAPDTYSTNVVWALPSGPPPGFHHAVIIDFTDPDHPVCRIESNASNMQGLPTCEQALAQGLGTKWLKVAALIATAPGDQTPYRGESSWGERISFLANDQFYLRGDRCPLRA
jgi:TonB family protein